MNLRTIPRTAVGGYIKLLRLPIDTANRALGRRSGTSATEVVTDQAEAAARDVAGAVTADPQLREQARRQRTAAGERRRATKLRAEATQRSQQADTQLAQRERQAEQRREDARRQAQKRREQAKEQAERAKAEASEAAQKRKEASEKAAEHARAAIEERTERERLAQLEVETKALDEREEALVAGSEAQRLGDAAARAKEQRKADDA